MIKFKRCEGMVLLVSTRLGWAATNQGFSNADKDLNAACEEATASAGR